MRTRERFVAVAIAMVMLLGLQAASAATRVRMSVDEDPIVLRLAESLGYLADEGIDLERVDVEKISGEDYLMQEPLVEGRIDAAYQWFSHAIYGARHGFPVKAVMMFNDAPGMKVLVAQRVAGEIHSAADFRGRRVAEGAGYGMKSVIDGYMSRKAGLAAGAYAPVFLQKEYREQNVLRGLEDGGVDVMTFEEPITSHLLDTGLVTTLFDLSSGEGTAQALGARFPAQSLLVAPAYADAHPDTVQHLVNAFVRAMRFVNSHSADEIAARLPSDYFAGKDRAAEVKLIRDTLPGYAKGDYALPADGVQLAVDVNLSSGFDQSVEGRWRATGDKEKVHPQDLYDNRFVAKAMQAIPAAKTATDQAQSEDTRNALRAQADRAGVIYKRGRQAHYTKSFDLSGLPHYEPKEILTGWMRLHGNNYLSDGLLGELWQQGFAKFQPGIRLSYFLPTSALAFAALYYDQADVVMAHRPGFYDLLAYERVKSFDPTEFTVVTGSYDVGGWENSLTILVNEDNPLACINMAQLDGIFGSERAGGWAGTNWRQDWARGPEKNIRTWGQLGLTGEWADKPIDVYGFSIRYNTATDFADRVLKGSDKWNERIQAYGNIVNPDGSRYIEADQITDHIGKDRYGIGYNRFRGERAHVKRLAVAPGDSKNCVAHTLDHVQDRTYPLFNEQYFYVSVKPGTKMDPKVKEFLRYVLSREGQTDVMKDGKYLPLTVEVVKAQLKKLEGL